MRTISATAMAEKNKLASSYPWIICLEITVPGLVNPIRVCSNGEDITWAGETWTAFPFEMDAVKEVSTGDVPRVDLRVSNVSRQMEAYIQDYDIYCKTNGYSPIEISISLINYANVLSSTPEVEYKFVLIRPKTNAKWATFTLGAKNPFFHRHPPYRMLKQNCRYKFKDARCGYAGGEAACDKTLARCRVLGNSERFGGTPGIGKDGIIVL
jgi:phage-related protein